MSDDMENAVSNLDFKSDSDDFESKQGKNLGNFYLNQ